LNSACAPPSVRAVPVTRATASPTRYCARSSAARSSGRPALRVAQPGGFHVIPRRLWRLLPYPVPIQCDPGGAVLDDVVGHVRPEACRGDQWATGPPLQRGPGAKTTLSTHADPTPAGRRWPGILGFYRCLERVRLRVHLLTSSSVCKSRHPEGYATIQPVVGIFIFERLADQSMLLRCCPTRR
jgi:hypothetical protein